MSNIKKTFNTLKKNLASAGERIARHTAETFVEKVKDKLPDNDPWLKIYKRSLKVVETDNGFGISVDAPASIDEVDAERTLVEFAPKTGNNIINIMAANNPWTLHTIPRILGGFNGDIAIKPGSKSAVASRRKQLLTVITSVESQLVDNGAEIVEGDLPKLNGSVKADLNFLGKSIEFGLNGMERLPHIAPVKSQLDKKGTVRKWLDKDATFKRSIIKEINDNL